MRILLVVGIILLGTMQTAEASDSSDGCGMGWFVTSDISLLATSVRGTTNGFLPPSFSMTSGTSGCADHSIVLEEKRAYHFLASNIDQVRSDVARGQGVYLDALAMTLGCDGQSMPSIGVLLRSHYQDIFPVSSDTSSSLYTLQSLVNEHGEKLGCKGQKS